MAKNIHNDVLDAGLNEIINNANQLALCSQEPTTRNEALVTYRLASTAIVPGNFTLQDGVGGGRRATVDAFNDILIAATGTGTHIALVDDTRLLFTTTCDSQLVTQNNLLDLPTWDVEFSDPT